MPYVLEMKVSPEAAKTVREDLKASIVNRGAEVTLYQPLGEVGFLSLVMRNRQSLDGWFLGALASWNEWILPR